VLAVLSSGWLSRARRLGRIVVIAVTIWGVAIAAFGFVHALWVGLLLLAVAGGADSVSAVCRSTMLQITTPDALRGRVSSTYSMVVVGGPYIGDVEAGSVASAFSPAVSVVSGGVACVIGAGVVTLAFPQLWSFDSTTMPALEEDLATAEEAVARM
jgi:MFS family permease